MLAVKDLDAYTSQFGESSGVNQLLIECGKSGRIKLLAAKLIDDFLVTGRRKDTEHFLTSLQKRFIMGRIEGGPVYNFGGRETPRHSHGDIMVNMRTYWRRVKTISMSRTRKKMQNAMAMANEIIQYGSLVLTLLYQGKSVLPQASPVVSVIQ